jgi:hypothetical protein
MKISLIEVPAYYRNYVEKVAHHNINELWQIDAEAFVKLGKLPKTFGKFRYADDKWTINELLTHIADTERIFNFRALCISRGETQLLPGFDQDVYVDRSEANRLEFHDVVDDLLFLRKSTASLFRSFSNDQLNQIGNANGVSFTPFHIAYILAGHSLHHLEVLEKKYLPSFNSQNEVPS